MSSSKIKLQVGGDRSIVITDKEAQLILKRFEKEAEGKEVMTIQLNSRSWTLGAVEFMHPFLKQIAGSVRILNLEDCIAGRRTEEGLKVTELLAQAFESSDLIDINLSDNAMGPRGLLRVKPLFDNSHLQRLFLSNCGLSTESMEMLRDSIVADDCRIAQSLTHIVLDKNMIGVEGAKVVSSFLSKCKNLEYFSYVGCRPEAEGTKYICEGIHELSESGPLELYHLDLDDCTIGSTPEDAVGPLSVALTHSPKLQYLSLRGGDLEVDGLEILVSALKKSRPKLSHLLLGKFMT